MVVVTPWQEMGSERPTHGRLVTPAVRGSRGAPQIVSATIADMSDAVTQSEANINALRALAPPPLRPVPRPSRPQPRTPQPRWSRRHSAHEPPGTPTAPARL